MKRYLLLCFFVFVLCGGVLAHHPATDFVIAPSALVAYLVSGPSSSMNLSSGILIDGTTKKIAYKFIVPMACTATAFDQRLAVGGDTTGVTLKGHIETDSSDVPSGVTVGSTSVAFAAPLASGWTGSQAFGSSASLAQNSFYWLVLEDGGGTAPTAANYTQGSSQGGNNGASSGGRGRQYNGADWTTTTEVAQDADFIVNCSEGFYVGGIQSSGNAINSARRVYSTTRTGTKFQIGGGLSIVGAAFKVVKVGSPNALEISLYKGANLLETITVPAANIPTQANSQQVRFYFSSTYSVEQGTNYFLYIHQASDGGTAGNYWAITAFVPNASYPTALLPSGWGYYYGTTADPTGWTAETAEIGLIFPIVRSIATGAAAGQHAYGFVQ